MSDEHIKIWIPKEDADIVQQIFERSDAPYFTIGKRTEIPELPDMACLELGLESSMSIWYLAQTVYVEKECNRKIKEALDSANKALDEFFKNKLNE